VNRRVATWLGRTWKGARSVAPIGSFREHRRTVSSGHQLSFATRSKTRPRHAGEGQLSGYELAGCFGSTRPQAVLDERPVIGVSKAQRLVRRAALGRDAMQPNCIVDTAAYRGRPEICTASAAPSGTAGLLFRLMSRTGLAVCVLRWWTPTGSDATHLRRTLPHAGSTARVPHARSGDGVSPLVKERRGERLFLQPSARSCPASEAPCADAQRQPTWRGISGGNQEECGTCGVVKLRPQLGGFHVANRD
jgi:hypothetical protein